MNAPGAPGGIVVRLLRRVQCAEIAGRHSASIVVVTGEELRQLEAFVWSTGCPPAHVERFDGRQIVVDES